MGKILHDGHRYDSLTNLLPPAPIADIQTCNQCFREVDHLSHRCFNDDGGVVNSESRGLDDGVSKSACVFKEMVDSSAT